MNYTRRTFITVATFSVAACNKSLTDLTGPSTTSLPGKVAGTTASITGFTFRRVANSSAPASSLDLWDLRGDNSEEAVRMMSFCGVGVTVPGAQQNAGLRPLRKPAWPFRLIVGPEFSNEEFELIKSNALVMKDQLGVPLTVERGAPVQFSGALGVINVFKNLAYEGRAASRAHVEGNLVVSGDIYWGTSGIVSTASVRHELGHVVGGLSHHNEEGLMSGRWTDDLLFSRAELDNLEMMRRLAPGTTYPGATSSSSSAPAEYTLDFTDCKH